MGPSSSITRTVLPMHRPLLALVPRQPLACQASRLTGCSSEVWWSGRLLALAPQAASGLAGLALQRTEALGVAHVGRIRRAARVAVADQLGVDQHAVHGYVAEQAP